mmetsp:Transcript_47667/g.93096  ORF Transcript_47667/g.93096 Transcript_47667/m.93096 type:complete len:184 (+) Transcript_47667:337-888(+)
MEITNHRETQNFDRSHLEEHEDFELQLALALSLSEQAHSAALRNRHDEHKIVDVAIALSLSEQVHSATRRHITSSFDENKIIEAIDSREKTDRYFLAAPPPTVPSGIDFKSRHPRLSGQSRTERFYHLLSRPRQVPAQLRLSVGDSAPHERENNSESNTRLTLRGIYGTEKGGERVPDLPNFV